ncbi:MAG: helix-turn-helix domain-containing protein [Treponema sp.]|jgi:transcriptional regulator with XRE-family HTH domain|nr:helix-turn-helix domain-containing protein [Treponema sp.]
MGKIRQILANNMKKYRQKQGLSQVKLAEKADVTPQYIAMIEMCSKFPKPEMLERLAKSLEVETHELFNVAPTPQDELEKIRQDIRHDIRQEFKQEIICEVIRTIKQSFAEESKNQKKM